MVVRGRATEGHGDERRLVVRLPESGGEAEIKVSSGSLCRRSNPGWCDGS